MSNTDIAIQIYHSALGLLARREHSRCELQQKLLQRFPNASDTISLVIMRLVDEGSQSDSRYAEAYVHSRLSKGYGLQRLRQELRQRGVDNQLIDATFMQASSDGKQIESLLQLWRKKFKYLPQNPKDKSRQINFLRYRGFSIGEIEDLLAYLIDNQGD